MRETDPKTAERLELLKQALKTLLPHPTVLTTDTGGLTVARVEQPTSPRRGVYKPLALLILQGTKRSVLGSEEFVFRGGQYLVTNLDIPSSCCVTEASPEKPYLALYIELSPSVISELLQEIGPLKEHTRKVHRAAAVAEADPPLIDAFRRLVELISFSEERRRILVPMVVREIHYLLLTGPLGKNMMTINTVNSKDNQILKAVERLKKDFAEKINITELAAEFGITTATFYRNFTKVTGMSPIRYQKQMRLNEAQRLMLAKSFNAQKAAYAVGYESVAQFSKEYKRHFGQPPHRHIKSLKNGTTNSFPLLEKLYGA